jgi:hypothetical protein
LGQATRQSGLLNQLTDLGFIVVRRHLINDISPMI